MSRADRFEEFITENLDGAYRFAFTYMKNKEDAEDVVCDSVVRAMKSLKTLKNSDGMKTWFFKIVANTALSELKRSQRCIPTDFSAENPHIAEPYAEDKSELILNDILSRLTEEYRGIVVLKICEEMTFAEISATLAISENTVKTRFYRGLQMLREQIAE